LIINNDSNIVKPTQGTASIREPARARFRDARLDTY